MFERKLYLPAPRPGVALWGKIGYVNSKLTREEITTISCESDVYIEYKRRISTDNGKTWSEPEALTDVTVNTPEGGIVTYPTLATWDLKRNIQYRFIMQRLWPGQKIYTYDWKTGKHPRNDHVFVSENNDSEILLRYEEGPDYDSHRPFNPDYCSANRAYLGNNAAIDKDGTIFFPVICATEFKREVLNGVCLMRRNPEDGKWTASNLQFVGLDVSSRGLLEPSVAVLKNGAVVVICRGSDTETTSGRKWITVSTDGGRTLSPVQELRYDDGSRFYSPSSIHLFIRSTRNGRLYWIANIVDKPPRGNSPRYPLCLTEIDEEKMAVRKKRVTIIDNRAANEPEALQLSNFCVLEDRETLDIEIYMTRLGENSDSFWESGIYRYIFSPPAD